MKKKVCKINIGRKKGTGFFCKIPFPNDKNLLSVLITNNHVIDELILKNEKKIKVFINKEKKEIELENRIKYTNEEYDITIIEIKNKDKIEDYLELDNDIINSDNESYIGESIYILHYQGSENIRVSYGIKKEENKENEYEFNHLCCTEKGSSGGPILNIKNNRVMGIHRAGKKGEEYNIGLYMKYGIKEFINNNIKLDLSRKKNRR